MYQGNPFTAALKLIGFGIIVLMISFQLFASFPGLLDKVLAFLR